MILQSTYHLTQENDNATNFVMFDVAVVISLTSCVTIIWHKTFQIFCITILVSTSSHISSYWAYTILLLFLEPHSSTIAPCTTPLLNHRVKKFLRVNLLWMQILCCHYAQHYYDGCHLDCLGEYFSVVNSFILMKPLHYKFRIIMFATIEFFLQLVKQLVVECFLVIK